MRFFALAAVSAVAEKVTPVEKVIQLMESMMEKGKAEKHAEEVQFAAYKQFCEDTEDEKTVAIEQSNERIEQLNAKIGKCDATVARLTKEIAAHEDDLATWEGDLRAATAVRRIQNSDFTALHKDYSESIDALTRAIAVLKKQSHDREQEKAKKEALVQVKMVSFIPAHAKKVIDAFLQGDKGDNVGLDVEAPEANAYEFQSGGVIQMLEKLLSKFNDEIAALENKEGESKRAYEMLEADLVANTQQARETVAAKKETKAHQQQTSAEAQGDLVDTQKTLDEDTAYKADLVATCKSKSDDFAARQTLRVEEMEAIKKAISIISAKNVAGHAQKYLPSLTQSSLLQIASDNVTPNKARAVAFLHQSAQRLHSNLLQTLAVSAENDPFNKVRKMIQDLITRLMEEANEEAQHKGWCDQELGTNEITRKQKTDETESLSAQVDELQSSIVTLGKRIKELGAEIVQLNKDMAEATKLRQEEKATNTQTIADSQESQKAVQSALGVLREFYAKAGQATALVQEPADAPEIFDSAYTGMQGENGGVIGMLEVIESDFARLEAETSTAESTAQNAYEKFMTNSKIDLKTAETDKEHKEAKKVEQTDKLNVAKDDLVSTKKELDAALNYFDKLKPSCVEAGVSYEDRVERRKEEIESLKEALKILQGEDI